MFPTYVGMIGQLKMGKFVIVRVPYIRGDGWGKAKLHCSPEFAFPTYVGMVGEIREDYFLILRVPHNRGDGWYICIKTFH